VLWCAIAASRRNFWLLVIPACLPLPRLFSLDHWLAANRRLAVSSSADVNVRLPRFLMLSWSVLTPGGIADIDDVVMLDGVQQSVLSNAVSQRDGALVPSCSVPLSALAFRQYVS
jgi:hypothetical protein